MSGIRRIAVLVPLADVPNLIPEDPQVTVVIAAAVAGNAPYIVSGDDNLRRLGEVSGIQILALALFLALLTL